MSGDDHPPSLDDLDARLRKARDAQEVAGRGAAPTRGMGQALRVAIEMVAAVAVGGVLGWFLDDWLETRPWFLVVFLLLGVAAGVLNAYRAASRITAAAEDEGESDGDAKSPEA